MQIKQRSGPGDWHLYGRLLSYVYPYWYFFLFSFLGYAIYSLGNVLLADLMQYLLDALGEAQADSKGLLSRTLPRMFKSLDTGEVEFVRVAVPVTLLLLTSFRSLGFFAGSYFMNHVARHIVHEIRCQLFDKMLVAPAAYYDSHSQGVLLSRITFNVEQITGAATKAMKIILRESLTIVALLSYMLYLNWRLCLIFIAVTPIIALVVRVVGRRFRRYSRRIQTSMGDVTQVARESIGAHREVRMFSGQEQQRERFRLASDNNRVQSLKLALAEALSTPIIQTLLALALAILVWFALSPAVLGGFSPGSLAAFLIAAGQLGKPVRQLSGIQSVVQRGLAAAEDIFAQLDRDAENDQGCYVVERARGELVLEHVSFTYCGAAAKALDDVSLTFPAGATVALVGRSGSGKSTLVHLLTRFYTCSEGRVSLDGRPIEEYKLDCYRQQYALVSQDVPLFRDTVYNNIAFGALAESDATEVHNAARLARVTQFVEHLPQGFDTLLGDEGGGLSGGQRQRIAIARAILKNAPILILDEATSALDYESEHHIQQALQSVVAGRTTIVIAHRLSTVEKADHIIVLDAGRIVAGGSHEELLRQGGIYAQLYRQEFTV